MGLQLPSRRLRFALCGLALVVFTADLAVRAAHPSAVGLQSSAQLGGDYASLDARRQRLVDDWVKRFNTAARQKLEPGRQCSECCGSRRQTPWHITVYGIEAP